MSKRPDINNLPSYQIISLFSSIHLKGPSKSAPLINITKSLHQGHMNNEPDSHKAIQINNISMKIILITFNVALKSFRIHSY